MPKSTVWRLSAHSALCVFGLLALSTSVMAQEMDRCSRSEYSQLDFWIGEWEVLGPDGEVIGSSVVQPILGGCAIREEWSAGGFGGIGYFAYDRPSDTWRQMWVDANGAVLVNTGRWEGSRMVLRGERKGSDGEVRELRVTLTPTGEGRVRQVLERSEDGGSTWVPIFEGLYRPSSP